MPPVVHWAIAVLAVVIVILFLRAKRSPQRPRLSRLVRDKTDPFPYIYINPDGSARELHAREKEFLETPFHPADGGRPYVKRAYADKDGWGEIGGFLKRSKLPRGAIIHPAPIDDPSRSFAKKEDLKDFLRHKGVEITENPDGTFTAKRPTGRN